jgi:hypothetical protein
MEITSVTKPAQIRYRPLPMDTSIPTAIGGVVRSMTELTDCVFFIMTVQIIAPMRRKMLPIMAENVERKKVQLLLGIPLCAQYYVGSAAMRRTNENTHVSRAKAAHIVPRRSIQ